MVENRKQHSNFVNRLIKKKYINVDYNFWLFRITENFYFFFNYPIITLITTG